jgi:CRISPR/Cas system-associated endonuclease/helicase Cas3
MLKNLKSLFIVEEETPKQEPAQPAPPAKTTGPVTPPPLPTTAATPPPLPRQMAGTIDQRIFESLEKAMEENNQQGFDFFEYKNSLKTLVGIIPDEATRYKSAYATAATMGVTVDRLLQSAAFYKSVLEKERDNFTRAVNQQVDLNVTAKQKEAERLQTLIAQKGEQIRRLTEEIAAHQEELAKAQGIITEATTRIEATKNNFHFTLEAVMDQIQADMQNIERYLQ